MRYIEDMCHTIDYKYITISLTCFAHSGSNFMSLSEFSVDPAMQRLKVKHIERGKDISLKRQISLSFSLFLWGKFIGEATNELMAI